MRNAQTISDGRNKRLPRCQTPGCRKEAAVVFRKAAICAEHYKNLRAGTEYEVWLDRLRKQHEEERRGDHCEGE